MLPNTILALNKWPKMYQISPKWRNFAKSGHSVCRPRGPGKANAEP